MTSYDKIENVIRQLELKVDELEKMACRALEIEEDEDTSNALEFRAMGIRDVINELNFLLLDIDD